MLFVRRCTFSLVLAASSFCTHAATDPFAENVRPTNALTPADELKSFTLPPGFQIQLVASEPDIHKPINLAFDAKGRLWLTSTVEYPIPVRDGRKPRDEVKVLEIDPATGHASKITTFADGLNIPTGVYPYKNGAIVFSIPNIYFLQDTDGDGVADKRDILYGPFDTTRDTHGMTNSFTRGYDGTLYATHGFNNHTTLKGADGSSIYMESGNIYRMALDGSHVDHITHGPVNPFGLAFDSIGNLFVADCHTKPFQVVLRGAWFEHFGRPHDGIGFYPMIMGHLHGSTAIGGVVSIDDNRWPAEFQGNLICGNPVTSRVDRDALVYTGATPAAKEKPDFVASTDPWFRPVAFAMATDGSIYVADFYNKVIGHYEVPLNHPGRDRLSGRIWRIVPPAQGSNKSMDLPRDLSAASVNELIGALAHPNITARMLATDQLTDRIGEAAVAPARAVLATGTATQKAHAMWALFRLKALNADEVIAAAKDADRLVRAHAMRVLAETRELTAAQLEILRAATKDVDAQVRLNAANALGLHPLPENLPALMQMIQNTEAGDTHAIYTARIALRNHLEVPGILAKLEPGEPAQTKAVNEVLPAVKSEQAGQFVVKQLSAGRVDGGNLNDLLKHASRFGGDAGTAAAADFANNHINNLDQQLEALKAIQAGTSERGGKISGQAKQWAGQLVSESLKSSTKNAKRLETLAELAKSLGLKDCAQALGGIATDGKADAAARQAAIKSLLALDGSQIATLVTIVASPQETPALREAAAKALSESNTAEARQALLKPISESPHALATKLAVALASRPEGAATLLDACERNTVLPRVLLEPTVKDKLNAAKIKDLEARVKALTQNLAPASAQLDQLIAKKQKAFAQAKPDPVKGQAVFAKNCAVCHQIGGQGALVGPQLDGVGARGADRLFEDIIDPNRNVDPMFRFTNYTTKADDTISALKRSETDQSITVVDATGKETTLSKADIKAAEVSKLSLMPTGFGEIIGEEDLNNLIGYLLSKPR